MYEYLLQGQYKITLSLIGCDSIDIHIMEVNTFQIIASMEVLRDGDNFKYRYFGNYSEHVITSTSELIYSFVEGRV